MKRTLSLLLALVLVLGTISTVFAAMPKTAEEKAELLKELGVLIGDESGNLMLDKDLNRAEGIVLLSRLMKEEDVAREFETEGLPFTDIKSPLYQHYVAWAFANEYTVGKSATEFDPEGELTALQYATFILRALGYEVDAKAFESGEALEKAKELGIFKDLNVTAETVLKRIDAAVMTFNALYVPMKDSEVTLGEFLELELPQEEPEVPATFELEDVSATNLREVDIVFNKDVDEDSLAKANFLLGTIEATSVELLEDGVTVRAIFSMDNQKEYTLKIKSIKSVDGQEIKDAEVKFVAFDNTPPVVENVEVFGNKKIVVTFSEPVEEATAKSLANYRIDDKLFGAKITVDGRKVHFELTARLADGVHTFVVSDNVKDYAGFRVLTNKNEIVVAKDDVKPEVASVDEVTQTKVVVTFTEPVEENFTVTANVGQLSSKSTKDNLTYTLNFAVPGHLPLTGTDITLKDVTDYYGNKNTIKINVVPEIDLTRPEVKSVTVKSQEEIIVEFTKDIKADSSDTPTGTYTVKTTDEEPKEVSVKPAYVQEKGENVKSKVKLTGEFAVGKYTIEITGAKDETPLENVVVPYVGTIEVPDLTRPKLKTAAIRYTAPTDSKEGFIYIYFSEKVDASTALDKANYSFVVDNEVYLLGSSHKIELLVNESVVKITIPKLGQSEKSKTFKLNSATIVNIKDLAGNVMYPEYLHESMEEDGVKRIAEFISKPVSLWNPRATAVNKVVLNVSADINPYSVVASDFVLIAVKEENEKHTIKHTIYVIDAKYSATNNTITLTLSEDLTPQAKFVVDGEPLDVKVKIVARNLENIYGEKLAEDNFKDEDSDVVADEIIPTLVKVETGENKNEIKFVFSEEVVGFDKTILEAGLVVKKDGKVVSYKVYNLIYKQVANKPNVFVVEFPEELGLSGETIEVGFPTITENMITDKKGNSLLPTGWFKVKVK